VAEALGVSVGRFAEEVEDPYKEEPTPETPRQGRKGSLAAAANPEVRRVLNTLGDAAIRQSLADLTPSNSHPLPSTTAERPECRERYTLTRLHAKGGIGQIWLARDEHLGRDVALKELRPERGDGPGILARFVEEARITGQLEHPGIVPVYELAGQAADQKPFYVMRFVKGRTLADAVKAYHRKRGAGEARPLDLRELLNAFVGVCNAVAYAHSRGVIHRDLKPQNIVLGDFGEVIVLDWGLAKVLGRAGGEGSLLPVSLELEASREQTLQGQVLGTSAYMSPEQAAGRMEFVDERSDIYALGAILYEVLTGRPPFTGSDTSAVLKQVLEDQPVAPRQLVARTSKALQAVCLKALAKGRDDRYSSAHELAREVQRWLADEPVAVYRGSPLTRLGRWGRQHKPLVSSAVAVLLVAVVAMAASTAVLAEKQEEILRQRNAAAESERKAHQEKVQADHTIIRVEEDVGYLVSFFGGHGNSPASHRRILLRTAEELYEGLIRQRPNDPRLQDALGWCWWYLGKAEEEMGDAAKAEEYYSKALTAC
jgi:serine/threonine-protein kinase